MAIYSTSPRLSIEIDGVEMANDLRQTLHTFRVVQALSVPSRCEMRFLQAPNNFLETGLSSLGSFIRVKVLDSENILFQGQITAIHYDYDSSITPLILIEAEDLLHQLSKRQPVRHLIEVNVNKLAQELTRDLGLSVEGGDNAPIEHSLIQFGQSDLTVLQNFALQHGHYFYLHDSKLKLFSLSLKDSGETLALGQNLFDAKFSVRAETAIDSITVTAWNFQRSTLHTGYAKTTEQSPNFKIKNNPLTYGSDGQRRYTDYAALGDRQADSFASAELERQLASQVTFLGIAEGNPHLIPGQTVWVQGVSKGLENRYLLTEVTHTLDTERGYTTEVNNITPSITSSDLPKNATLGKVTQVEDPDNLGRIKVCLPTYNDVETDWLQVLSPGAGNNKGQLMLPDVDDHVLLLFINGLPSQAIVLGGVYGEKPLPCPIIQDGAVKGFVTKTAGEQTLYLNDTDTSISLETQSGHRIHLKPDEIGVYRKNGSRMTLTNDLMTIHSETALTITAPGNNITISANKINFEEA